MFVFYYDVLILKIKKIKKIYFNIFLNKIYIYIYIYKNLYTATFGRKMGQ
jgi:hypothetical protein